MDARATIAIALLLAGQAAAQVAPGVWPRCIAERDGQEIGVGGSICECRYEPGGTMIRRPPGWRWSCDIMRMDGEHADLLSGSRDRERGSGLPPGFVYAPQFGNQAGQAGQPAQGGQAWQTTPPPPVTPTYPYGPTSLFGRKRW